MADAGLRRARFSVAAVFFYQAFLIASWASRIPQIKAAAGLSDGLFGLALLSAPLASIAAMRPVSRALARQGSKTLIRVSLIPFAAATILLADARSGPWLAIALACIGATGGALGVSMNAQGVEVERGYGRPLMNGFHACYSAGGLVGALAGSLAAHAGYSPLRHVALAAIAAAALCLAATGGLVPRSAEEPAAPPAARSAPQPVQHRAGRSLAHRFADRLPGRRELWILAAIVFCLLLSEGAMADWSALFLKDSVNATAATAALGYAMFSLAMTVGRTVGNRIVAALGPVTAVRCGAGLAAVSLSVGLSSNSPVIAVAGFGFFGLGMSVIAPTAFSAAGNMPGMTSGSALAAVSAAGYLGLFVGPGLIGNVAQLSSLAVALGIPALLVAAMVLLAPAVRPVGEARMEASDVQRNQSPAPRERTGH
jgi:predicted MFS family arabinose efflux permease